MAEEIPTWCRLNECMAGLVATVDGGRIQGFRLDAENPLGRHDACGLCEASGGAAGDPRRILRPRKRTPGGWEDIGWEQALDEIAGRLKDIRRQSGARAIGTYVGPSVGTNAHGVARCLAWALGLDSPSVYSPLSTTGGPWTRAVEHVLGHAAALQGDVGRAHYVVLLGANQQAQGWGPLQAGRNLPTDLAFSRKTKGTKVVAVDPRRTPMALAADQHVAIRPGTELWFVLGMLDQVVKNAWHDAQFVRDYCSGWEALGQALAAWPVETCAAVCGVTPEEIGGTALKFSRAAMAVAHRSPQALASQHGTLTAWALIVLHAITANLLRPGGLYDNKGVLDIHPLAAGLPTDGAPRTRTGGFPLHLLQAPAAILADEILSPGEGALRALVAVQGDPAREVPGGDRLRNALAGLDLLVAIDVAETETTRMAHYVLPGAHCWERADLHLHDTSILPWKTAQATPALVAVPGEARDEAAILADLFRRVGPTRSLSGNFGLHLRLLGTFLATQDLPEWDRRAMELSGKLTPQQLAENPHGWNGGEVDRATWRVTTGDGKIALLPEAVARALAGLQAPSAGAGMDRWLLTSAARDPALRPFDRAEGADPGVTLHPSAGFGEGDRVRVVTRAGAVATSVHLDPSLRPDTVDLPAGYAADVMALIPTETLDPLSGTPALNGLACRVERA
jgi:formate dehydrogenase